jgi:hypothetical protein
MSRPRGGTGQNFCVRSTPDGSGSRTGENPILSGRIRFSVRFGLVPALSRACKISLEVDLIGFKIFGPGPASLVTLIILSKIFF